MRTAYAARCLLAAGLFGASAPAASVLVVFLAGDVAAGNPDATVNPGALLVAAACVRWASTTFRGATKGVLVGLT